MFTPIDLNKTIIVDGYKFKTYSIENYDFRENIDFPSEEGVYFFSKRYPIINNLYYHIIMYFGKTKNFRTRFINHDMKKYVLSNKSDLYCLSIHTCKKSESIEKDFLSRHSFPYNYINNANLDLYSIIVMED